MTASTGRSPERPRAARAAAWVLVALAVATIAARILDAMTPAAPRPENVAWAAVNGLVAAMHVLVPALLFGRPAQQRPAPAVVSGFLLIALAQVAGTLISLAIDAGFRTRGLSTFAYSVALIASPAATITAAIGVVLIAFGFGRAPGAVSRATAVVACAGLWLVLAPAFLLQYLLAYAMSPPLLLGSIATGAIAAVAWLSVARVAARRRRPSTGFGPLAAGSALVGLGGAAGVILVQVATTDPSRYRSMPFPLTVAGALVAIGWALVVLAAARGLPSDPESVTPAHVQVG